MNTENIKITLDNEIDNNQLIIKIKEIIKNIDGIKESFYPKNMKLRNVYMKDAPTKHDFVNIRSRMRTLLKTIENIIKKQYKKENKSNLREGCGFLRMVKIKPDLVEFIKTKEKGLDNIYSDALLTSYFTNYFFTMKCKQKSYIIPNKELIQLFKQEFIKDGIIDNNNNLLLRKDIKKNGEIIEYKGFKFIHLQRLLKNKILVDINGKREIIENINDDIINIFENEKTILNDIKIFRKEYDLVINNIDKKKSMFKKAQDLNDLEDYNKEIDFLEKQKQEKLDILKKYCVENNFPCIYN